MEFPEAIEVTVADPLAKKQTTPSLLIVDDNEAIRNLLLLALQNEGQLEIEAVANAREARERLAERCFTVAITDISMPGEDGISLMQWARESRPGTCWIVLTGHGTLDLAVRALQLGAFDFIAKPLSIATLKNVVGNALDQQRLRAERDQLHKELQESNERLGQHVDEVEQACRLLEEQAERIQADLLRAALIQRALLPQVSPNTPGLSVHALYRPSHMVGGDLYDVVRLDRQRLILLVADAAGHGLSAAMLSVLFRNRLAMVDPDTNKPYLPSHALRSANDSLLRGFATPGLFLTAAYCLIDMTNGHLTAASAGHPPLIVQRKSGDIEHLFHTGPALGLYPEAQFTDEEIVLEAGDRLLLHTDGLYDRLPASDSPPSDRVVSALRENTRDGVDDEGALLIRMADLSDTAGEADSEVFEDDITLLSLCVTSAPSALDNGSHAPPPPAPPGTAIHKGVEILAGGNEERATFSIRGTAGWAESAAFHQACMEAIETTRALTLDLTLCDNLDSTFLGTIHELVNRADQAQVEFRLQGVTPPVEALFAELGMKRILERMVPRMLPLPTHMSPLTIENKDAHTQGLRILKAHESLAAINERNRSEFDPLLLSLREEMQSSA